MHLASRCFIILTSSQYRARIDYTNTRINEYCLAGSREVRKILILTMTLIMGIALIGCGISQEDYDAVIAERDAASAELAEIKKVYPPGDFASVTELEAWVRNNVQPSYDYLDETFRTALIVQSQGLDDGYLISVMYDEDDTDPDFGWIYCGALVNGVLYIWLPEETEVYSYADYDFTR